MDKIDCLVIGAGVVGLAIARSLCLLGRDVVVLEKEAAIGKGISSRNSEVVHAGIYYPSNSLKAQLCVKGQKMLYDYCDNNNIDYKRTGKLIVASNSEEHKLLLQYQKQAVANNTQAVKLLDKSAAVGLEPSLNCLSALLSTSTGIVDSHQLIQALAAEIQSSNGHILCQHPVVNGLLSSKHSPRVTIAGVANTEIECQLLVNAAGLSAVDLSRRLSVVRVPELQLAKGSYFTYTKTSPFQHLVYPVANGGALGVHSTLDLQNNTRFGPDIEWLNSNTNTYSSLDYQVDASKKTEFANQIRAYFPEINEDDLQPAYAGIRPKLKGQPFMDFYIAGQHQHGKCGFINVLGIESPGLTAALAIGELIAQHYT